MTTTTTTIFTTKSFSHSKLFIQAYLGRYAQAGRSGWRRRSPVQLSAMLESHVQNFLINLLQVTRHKSEPLPIGTYDLHELYK